MNGTSFCSPPKVQRSLCLTETLEVVESPGVAAPLFLSDSSEPTFSSLVQGSGGTSRPHTSDVSQNSVSLEGVLIDQAVDTLLTLPEVVGQVSAIQKDHHQEIQRQLMLLHKLENDIKQSKEKCCSVMKEMSSVDRKTRMLEEEVSEREKMCHTYQKEIELLVTVCESLRHNKRAKTNELKAETSKHALYMTKMEEYKTKVAEFERTLPSKQKLLNLQQRMKDLQKQKQEMSENTEEFTAMCGGEKEVWIRRDIEKVKMRITTLNEEFVYKQKQLSDLKSQEKKIQLAISVLHKRNAAQLTRLKRQVKEQQVRRRQWQDQHSQLQHSIADINTKLEE